MAFIAPKFRRESWYGRLYLRAYGADRGWLVRLQRLTFSTGFGYTPYPKLTGDMSEAEQLTRLLNWRNGREDALERCRTFLMAPPSVQPFVETGPKVSICPTFWKIVFAMLVYCPIVVLCAAGRVIRDAVVAASSAITSAFRWSGRRFGRPLAWAGASAFMLAAYCATLYGAGWLSYHGTGKLMGRQGMSHREAWAKEEEAKNAAWIKEAREELRQYYSNRCATDIQASAEYAEHRTADPDVECDVLVGGMSHEEQAQRCVGRDELHLYFIERVAAGEHACTNGDRWDSRYRDRAFPDAADRREFFARIAQQLRERFAKEVRVGLASRARRIAEAKREDARVVGGAVAELLPLRLDPPKLYEQFTNDCWYDEYHKRWAARLRYGDVSNATCATLAGLFRSEIASVESARRWTEQKTVAKKFAIGSGLLIAVLIGASLIAAFLWTVFGDHGRAIGRALAWCFDEVAWPVGKWTVIIATAPIWVPVRYLLWPALCLIGRSFRSVGLACWNVWPVRTVRSAFVSVFTGIASGIRRFAAATRQVLADTWHLLRAFASAKWERLCPFIEWN